MLYGGNPGHIMNPLCAVQGRNPDSEIPHYLEACRVHRVEQRRERAAVTIDDGWISVREQRLPLLDPWHDRGEARTLVRRRVHPPLQDHCRRYLCGRAVPGGIWRTRQS